MRVCLVTLGDPRTLTGGYLFHWRLADLAPARDADVSFFSFPDGPFPMPVAAGPRMVSAGRACDVMVIDSIAAWCAAPWLGRVPAPVVGMLHQLPGGMDNSPIRRRAQAVLDRRAYRHMDRILVASRSLEEDLAAEIDARRIVVVAPGRDVAEPDGTSMDLRRGRKVAFLSVGNWVARKGTVDLLRAFQAVPPDLAMLHLVGRTDVDTNYARRVRELLEHPGLRDRVVIHGPVPKERVASMYLAADAFVLPSIEEPYGTVYGEAMASGLPVLGWDAGNLPYLARDGSSGLIVPTGDIRALTTALIRIAEDDELRSRLAAGAEEGARSFPTWEETAALFFAQLRQVVAALKSHTAP